MHYVQLVSAAVIAADKAATQEEMKLCIKNQFRPRILIETLNNINRRINRRDLILNLADFATPRNTEYKC